MCRNAFNSRRCGNGTLFVDGLALAQVRGEIFHLSQFTPTIDGVNIHSAASISYSFSVS